MGARMHSGICQAKSGNTRFVTSNVYKKKLFLFQVLFPKLLDQEQCKYVPVLHCTFLGDVQREWGVDMGRPAI
jgi:hypothetical protein